MSSKNSILETLKKAQAAMANQKVVATEGNNASQKPTPANSAEFGAEATNNAANVKPIEEDDGFVVDIGNITVPTKHSAEGDGGKKPGAGKSADYIGARDNRADFFSTWAKKIEMFVGDSTRSKLVLPAELTANDRRELHSLAEKFNLSHHSAGQGRERHLVLTKDELHFQGGSRSVDVDSIINNPQNSTRYQQQQQRQQQQDGQGQGQWRRQYNNNNRNNQEPKKVQADKEAIRAYNRLIMSTDQFHHAEDTGFGMDDDDGHNQGGGQRPAQGGGQQAEVVATSGSLWNQAFAAGPHQEIGGGAGVEAGISGVGKKRTKDEADRENHNDNEADRLPTSTKKLEVPVAAATAEPATIELEKLSLNDALELAKMNDLSDQDVDFLDKFANTFHSDRLESVEKFIQFPLDPEEVVLPGGAPSEEDVVILVKQNTSESKTHIGTVLTALLMPGKDSTPANGGGAVFPSSEFISTHVVVVYPGVSMYGAEMVAAVVVPHGADGSESIRTKAASADWRGEGLQDVTVQVGGKELLTEAF